MISQIIFETSFAGLIIYLVWVCFLLALGQNSQSDKVELGFDQSYRLVILVPALNEEAVIKQTTHLGSPNYKVNNLKDRKVRMG